MIESTQLAPIQELNEGNDQQKKVEWLLNKLEDLVTILDGKRKPIKKAERVSGAIPYYGATGIIDWVNDYIFDEELILIGEDGENLRSRVLPMAFKIKGKSWVNNHAHVIKPHEKMNIDFMTYYLNYINYDDYITGSAQPKLNQAQLRNILIVCPPLKEQKKIAEILLTVDEQIENTEQLIEKTKELKKGLMQQLLTKGIGHTKFKQTKLGEIPEDWNICNLGELFHINTKSISPLKIDEIVSHFSIPAYDGNKSPQLESSKNIKSNKTILKEDSFLVSKLNPRINRVWKVDVSKFKNIMLASTEFINYVPYTELNREFFYQYFTTEMFQYELILRESGTTGSRKRVTPSSTLDIKVLLPTLHEQGKIASILSTVDEQIETYEQEKEKYNELKKGLMQQLLTGKVRVKV